MSPREIQQALRDLPAPDRRRITRALRRHAEVTPIRACVLLECDAAVSHSSLGDGDPPRDAEVDAAALLGARRVLDALLGAELGRWVWAALLGQNGRPPPHLRRPAARAVAKLRHTLFATNEEGGGR